LNIFWKVRERTNSGLWCDLDGNAIQGGYVSAVRNSGVSIESALAGRRYVEFEKGTFTKIGQHMKERLWSSRWRWR